MITDVKAKVDQLGGTAPMSNGEMEYPALSKMGQIFTANWQTRLALAGKVFSLDLGAAETHLAGNHDYDQDQPEFVVAIDSGWLIPISVTLFVWSDCDADADSTEVLILADRTQAAAAALTGTEETALNALDGGDAFGGRCYSVMTGSVGTVTEADILLAQGAHGILTTEGHFDAAVNVNHEWNIPRFLAGPCQIIGYCVGVGDAQVSAFIGSISFAHLPASWITVS